MTCGPGQGSQTSVMNWSTEMQERLDYFKAAPGVYTAMLRTHEYLGQCGLERSLLDLVYLRASQINGCAFCVDMHWKDLRASGESEQRLYLLDAWRESPGYSDREQAALEWTEAVTRITEGHVPDDAYHLVREQFTETELTNLTLAVATINSWNRLNIAFRKEAGAYRVASADAIQDGSTAVTSSNPASSRAVLPGRGSQ
jgi:AhpD family alkylhydroperoxidase